MEPMSSQLSTSDCNIEFHTSPAWFRTIRLLILAACQECGFSTRDAGQISMAVDEALSNIFRHGYQGSTEGRVRLTFKTTLNPSPKITIELEDDAIQVDTDLIRSRDLDDIKPGGLGVHLIQTVMDEATWQKRVEGGMLLSMCKNSTAVKHANVQSKEHSNG